MKMLHAFRFAIHTFYVRYARTKRAKLGRSWLGNRRTPSNYPAKYNHKPDSFGVMIAR